MKLWAYRRWLLLVLLLGCFLLAGAIAQAEEVDKGKIPPEYLVAGYKKATWGSPIWDVAEAIEYLKSTGQVLWVDTRPESFFKQGTVRGAVLLTYDKKESAANGLTAESLKEALDQHGPEAEAMKIAFFCQGPKCHRSYNAAYTAVTEWGYSPDQVVWFRAGYPHLFQAVKNEQKLKRKAKRYLSDAGVRQL